MISLVATVKNEKENIEEWIDSLFSQSVQPDEIVIVDGGSEDGTWETLQKKASQRIKVFRKEGNISAGRNFAISQASGENIVVTDGGCAYDRRWFEKLSEGLVKSHCGYAATGFGPWLKEGDSFLTRLFAAATIPSKYEFKKDWLPSSRSVAFNKQLWHNAGGYPEWIPICEDVVFDLKIKKMGIEPVYIREPLVFWRPRTNFIKYLKQLFGYTRSDGHGKLWPRRQLIRFFVYGAFVLIIFLAIRYNFKFLVLVLFGGIVYVYKFWIRWFEFAGEKKFLYRLAGAIFIPFIIFLGDVAKMAGWPVGVYERVTYKVKFTE